MSTPFHAAARRLQAIIEAENAALATPDVARVSALLHEKLLAAQDLAMAAKSVVRTPETLAFGQRLRELSDENTRLLERAIKVQSRVVELVARAARSVQRPAVRYGAAGRETQERGGFALATRV